jgi:hypothetical protein
VPQHGRERRQHHHHHHHDPHAKNVFLPRFVSSNALIWVSSSSLCFEDRARMMSFRFQPR